MKKQLKIATLGGAAVAVLVSVHLALLATTQYVSYDSFWHVFIARQDSLAALWREELHDAHPPLHYLLVRVASFALGRSPFVYRLWSIVGIAVSTLLLARLTCRLTRNAPLSIVAAAALGFSSSGVEIGLEVRSYAPLLAFSIAAACAWVEWIAARPDRSLVRTRIIFAVSLCGALLSHYSAFFLLGASLAVPVLLLPMHSRWRARLRSEIRTHRAGLTGMFGAPVALAIAAWAVHLRRYEDGIGHVSEFLFDRHLESRLGFLLRTLRSAVVLFLPESGLQGWPLALLGGLAAAALLWLTLRRAARRTLAVVPFAFLITMAAANALAALRGRYPFGGLLRHEIYLFPFAVLAVFVGIDLARRAAPAIVSNRLAWAAAAALLVVASSRHAAATFPSRSEELDAAQFAQFERHFGTPAALMVDQFNLFMVFGHYHQWNWHLHWELPFRAGMWQVWEVEREGRRFFVCRENAWQSDFSKPDIYGDASECLARTGADRLAVFRPQQPGVPPTWVVSQTPALAHRLARSFAVDPLAVVVDGDDVYASVGRAAEPPNAARLSIVSASFGENCRAVPGNATTPVREACEERTHCVARPGAIGNPAPACAKDFRATIRCGDQPPVMIRIAAPVEPASVVPLSCLGG